MVWEELEQNAGEETRLSVTYLTFSVTYLTFMAVAMLIVSIGVLLDQPILIIGAMVVGPEFGPLVALCVSIVGSPPSSGQSCPWCTGARVLAGMAAPVLFTWVMTAFGLAPCPGSSASSPAWLASWR